MNVESFLLARISEDEAVARAAIATDAPDPWENPTTTGNHWPENIAFWDQATPYRFLRECAAKRAIAGMHRNNPSPYGDQYCATCSEVGQDGKDFPCETVKALAAVYADHPEYQEEWEVG